MSAYHIKSTTSWIAKDDGDLWLAWSVVRETENSFTNLVIYQVHWLAMASAFSNSRSTEFFVCISWGACGVRSQQNFSYYHVWLQPYIKLSIKIDSSSSITIMEIVFRFNSIPTTWGLVLLIHFKRTFIFSIFENSNLILCYADTTIEYIINNFNVIWTVMSLERNTPRVTYRNCKQKKI